MKHESYNRIIRGPKLIVCQMLKSVCVRFFPRMYQRLAVPEIQKIWKRADRLDWPLPERRHKCGLEKYEYSLFSQNGEDGILRYLFSEIGFRSRLFLEFGFGVTENNSLRLALHENFGGVYIDGSESVVSLFNSAASRFGLLRVRAFQRFLDLDNLKTIVRESGLLEEIDLLSIDVDGNDYWFWKCLDGLKPRVVVVEYNASLGPDLSLTVPYDPFFDRHKKHVSGFYCGASLEALERLGNKKGYCLVGCDSQGVNAFFVRKDCLTQNVTPRSSREVYRPHGKRLERGFSMQNQYNIIKDLPFVTVD